LVVEDHFAVFRVPEIVHPRPWEVFPAPSLERTDIVLGAQDLVCVIESKHI
jgi:hypothetical protein